MRRFASFGLLVAALAAPSVLVAQQAAPGVGAQEPARRAQAERKLRQTLYAVTQRRVGLSEAQMTRLESLTRALAPRRAALLRRERDVRQTLRRELASERPDTQLVAAQLEEMQRVFRDRLALQEREARELASFMGPVQRARYFALQEQLRRRVDGMRPRQADGDPAPGEAGMEPRRLPRRQRPF